LGTVPGAFRHDSDRATGAAASCYRTARRSRPSPHHRIPKARECVAESTRGTFAGEVRPPGWRSRRNDLCAETLGYRSVAQIVPSTRNRPSSDSVGDWAGSRKAGQLAASFILMLSTATTRCSPSPLRSTKKRPQPRGRAGAVFHRTPNGGSASGRVTKLPRFSRSVHKCTDNETTVGCG
jgi:hypothetical protein